MQCLRFHRRPRSSPVSYPPSLGSRSLRGFTLIELMVTISVLAVLAAIAVPNFNDMIKRWRVMQTAELFQSTLYLARSEALKRGGNVVVERLPCGSRSTGSEWDCGWQVCHNVGGKCSRSGEDILQRQDIDANLDITFSASSGGQRIIFNRFGRSEGKRGIGLSILPKGESTSHPAARGVCLASGGRVNIIQNPPCDK